MKLRRFTLEGPKMPLASLPDNMNVVRKLLKKPSLSKKKVQKLIDVAQDLCRHSKVYITKAFPRTCTSNKLTALMRRFLVIDALFGISMLAGTAMPFHLWWNEVYADDLVRVTDLLKETRPTNATDVTRLVDRFVAALHLYSVGVRPRAEEIVALKQVIFRTRKSETGFTSPEWKMWRQDDKEFWNNLGHSSNIEN